MRERLRTCLLVVFLASGGALALMGLGSAPVPPSYGVRLPVKVVRVIDGDTVVVQPLLTIHVRLLDCWAPEKNERGGREATERLKQLAEGKTGVLFVPFDHSGDLSKSFTFGRILGRIEIDGRDVGSILVKEGLAGATDK